MLRYINYCTCKFVFKSMVQSRLRSCRHPLWRSRYFYRINTEKKIFKIHICILFFYIANDLTCEYYYCLLC